MTDTNQNVQNQNIKRTITIDPIWQRFTNLSSGHFEALVRLQGNYRPDYLKILGNFSADVFKVQLPSSALSRITRDEGVLSLDLREYVVA
jgi:hypothetical protein